MARRRSIRVTVLATCLALGPLVGVADAGMMRVGPPLVLLEEMARMRLEVISFFLLVGLGCTVAIRGIWNRFAESFPALPRMNMSRALCLVLMIGSMCMVILVMISGARELMTPGAWELDGATYRLKPGESRSHRTTR